MLQHKRYKASTSFSHAHTIAAPWQVILPSFDQQSREQPSRRFFLSTCNYLQPVIPKLLGELDMAITRIDREMSSLSSAMQHVSAGALLPALASVEECRKWIRLSLPSKEHVEPDSSTADESGMQPSRSQPDPRAEEPGPQVAAAGGQGGAAIGRSSSHTGAGAGMGAYGGSMGSVSAGGGSIGSGSTGGGSGHGGTRRPSAGGGGEWESSGSGDSSSRTPGLGAALAATAIIGCLAVAAGTAAFRKWCTALQGGSEARWGSNAGALASADALSTPPAAEGIAHEALQLALGAGNEGEADGQLASPAANSAACEALQLTPGAAHEEEAGSEHANVASTEGNTDAVSGIC